jgi:hypothetical protein
MVWKGTGLRGLDIVEANLNKEIRLIEGRSMKGLIEAAAFIRTDMDKTPPLIPVKTGNMRSSWFTIPYRLLHKMAVIIGFSANYSIYVHEMTDDKYSKPIEWTRPGSGPKFFQAAIGRNTNRILEIIRRNARVR